MGISGMRAQVIRTCWYSAHYGGAKCGARYLSCTIIFVANPGLCTRRDGHLKFGAASGCLVYNIYCSCCGKRRDA
jgi:hypothetical protein